MTTSLSSQAEPIVDIPFATSLSAPGDILLNIPFATSFSSSFDGILTIITVSSLTISAGNNQTGNAGTTLPVGLQVLALDNMSNPVSGATITFTVVLGGGNLSSLTVNTDINGLASTNLTL